MQQQIDVRTAQLRIMIFLLVAAIPAFGLMLTRTFGENNLNIQKEWGWLLTAVMPVLSLVIGTYAATAHQSQTNKTADKAFYKITVALGLVYMGIVTAAIIFSVFDSDSSMKTLDNISVVIGPVQGLVSAGLGVFFVSQKAKPPARPNQPVTARKSQV